MLHKYSKSLQCVFRFIVGLSFALIVAEMPCEAQQKAREYIDSIFVSLLQTDGILLTDTQKSCPERCELPDTWKNANQKRKRTAQDDELKKLLLSNFFPGSIIVDQAIHDQYVFKNRSIAFMGSQIISNGNIAQLQTSNLPLIPVIGSGNQLSLNVLDKNTSNYLLNFSTRSVFQGSLAIDAAVKNNPFIQIQAGKNSTKTEDQLQSITIAAGIFKNQLGDLFERLKTGNINSMDFTPLYYIWSLYKSEQITKSDSCLLSFNGLCYSTDRILNLSSNSKYTVDVEAKYSIPILSSSVTAKGDWDEARNLTSRFTSYSVIMFERPKLIQVPSLMEIESAWRSLSSRYSAIRPVAGILPLPYNSELSVILKFGPVPNANILNSSLEIDQKFTFSKIGANNLVKDLTIDKNESKPDNEGYYSIKLTLVPNDLVINDLNSDSILEVPIRLYYSNVVGKDTLDIKYPPLLVKSEDKPIPYRQSELKEHKLKNESSYEYEADIYVDPPSGSFNLITSGSKVPKIMDIAGLNPVDQSAVRSKILQSCDSKANSIANSFHLTFDIDSIYFYNSIPEGGPLEFQVKFFDNNSNTPRPFNKKFYLKPPFPDDVVASKKSNKRNATALFNTNTDLIAAMDTSLVLKNNATLGEYIKSLIGQNVNSPLPIIEAIKENTDLILTEDNKYLIATRYLKKKL